MDIDPNDPKAITKEGERLYDVRYKPTYESSYPGWFVVIDIKTAKAYPAPTIDEAVRDARQDAPDGLFHVMRVGDAAAFHVSYRQHADPAWALR